MSQVLGELAHHEPGCNVRAVDGRLRRARSLVRLFGREKRCGVVGTARGIAEGLKAEQRQSYLRSVAVRQIESVDWRIRSIMAAVLVERHSERLSHCVRSANPDQLADSVFPLLTIVLGIKSQMKQFGANPYPSPC